MAFYLQIKLTLQKIAIQTSPKPVLVKKNHVIKEELVQLVSGQGEVEPTPSLAAVTHAIMYLTMDSQSESSKDKVVGFFF